MRLDPPEDFTDSEKSEEGNPNYRKGEFCEWFPWVCGHCYRCYWYRPADPVTDIRDLDCQAWWSEHKGEEDAGTRFWKTLLRTQVGNQ